MRKHSDEQAAAFDLLAAEEGRSEVQPLPRSSDLRQSQDSASELATAASEQGSDSEHVQMFKAQLIALPEPPPTALLQANPSVSSALEKLQRITQHFNQAAAEYNTALLAVAAAAPSTSKQETVAIHAHAKRGAEPSKLSDRSSSIDLPIADKKTKYSDNTNEAGTSN